MDNRGIANLLGKSFKTKGMENVRQTHVENESAIRPLFAFYTVRAGRKCSKKMRRMEDHDRHRSVAFKQFEADRVCPSHSCHQGTSRPRIYDIIEPINCDSAMTR